MDSPQFEPSVCRTRSCVCGNLSGDPLQRRVVCDRLTVTQNARLHHAVHSGGGCIAYLELRNAWLLALVCGRRRLAASI